MFLGKGVLKTCTKFTGEQPCRSAIWSNYIEITLQHGCSPVNLLQIFRTPFPKNTSEGLLLFIWFELLRIYPVHNFHKKEPVVRHENQSSVVIVISSGDVSQPIISFQPNISFLIHLKEKLFLCFQGIYKRALVCLNFTYIRDHNVELISPW